MPYFNPHLLRNTLVQVAYDRKLDAEAFKAWSQNLGHESCLTTFSSYGTVPTLDLDIGFLAGRVLASFACASSHASMTFPASNLSA